MAEDVDIVDKPQVLTLVVAEPKEIRYDEKVNRSIGELDKQFDFWASHFSKDSPNLSPESVEIRAVDQALNKINFSKYGLDNNTEPDLRARIEAGIADYLYSNKKDSLKQWVINRAEENELGIYNNVSGVSLLKTAAQLFPDILERYKKLRQVNN